jgi:hypothetical protein
MASYSRFPHSLPDELRTLPLGGWRHLIQRSQERFVQLDQYIPLRYPKIS